MAEVSAEHVFSIAMLDVMTNGMTPEQAIDKAFKRAEGIFAKYPIAGLRGIIKRRNLRPPLAEFAPENQVRTGLPAGGRWIRTIGPPSAAIANGVRRATPAHPAVNSAVSSVGVLSIG